MKPVQPALVICCKDYRYIQAIQRFVKRRGVPHYDLKATAGGLRAILDAPAPVRQWLLKDVRLVYGSQRVRRIIIVQHQDCAAYGGAARFDDPVVERQFHHRQFQRARRLLLHRLAGARVEGFFASGAPGKVQLTSFT